jgi:hypothetical protein
MDQRRRKTFTLTFEIFAAVHAHLINFWVHNPLKEKKLPPPSPGLVRREAL